MFCLHFVYIEFLNKKKILNKTLTNKENMPNIKEISYFDSLNEKYANLLTF